jgi:hypothetical protein
MEDFLIERELLEGIANKLKECINICSYKINRDEAISLYEKITVIEPGSVSVEYHEFVNDPNMDSDT